VSGKSLRIEKGAPHWSLTGSFQKKGVSKQKKGEKFLSQGRNPLEFLKLLYPAQKSGEKRNSVRGEEASTSSGGELLRRAVEGGKGPHRKGTIQGF